MAYADLKKKGNREQGLGNKASCFARMCRDWLWPPFHSKRERMATFGCGYAEVGLLPGAIERKLLCSVCADVFLDSMLNVLSGMVRGLFVIRAEEDASVGWGVVFFPTFVEAVFYMLSLLCSAI
jgi:hypothetical protein